MRLAGMLGVIVALALPVPAAALDTGARAALVVDHDTGAVLLSKNAEAPMPPASMSKLMTLVMVFEALKDGRLSLDDTFLVSEKAWKMGGSKMFLRAGEDVRIEDLIRGIIVQSGNDACVVVAEGMAGSEAAFADRMTRRARELGMMDSTFINATGWPHPDHVMSARDLVRVSTYLIDEFPEYYPYFSELAFTWDDIEQQNRNPLLGLDIGADGLKTGHTEEAGYGLVGSALRDGRRVTMMITGLDSARERLVEAERIVSWSFREFYSRTLFESDQSVATADVWLGDTGTVALVPSRQVRVVVPFADRDNVEARVIYEGPLQAPIEQGAQLAELVVTVRGIGETRFPLHAANSVGAGGFVTRVQAAASILAGRVFNYASGMLD